MIASLPMYQRPSNRAAHDALWARIRDGLRSRGIDAPQALDHDINHIDGWAHPDLVLGQICNLPYRARFRDHVTLIGAADYGLPDCKAGYYNSVFVIRQDDVTGDNPADFTTARFAANDLLSQSGYGAAHQWAAAQGITFGAPLITGSHHNSIRAVATEQADIAAIDAQTWRMERNEKTAASRLRVIGQTPQTPGMSFITRAGQDPAPYHDAIKAAIDAMDRQDQAILGLRGIVALPPSAYDIPLPPAPSTVPA